MKPRRMRFPGVLGTGLFAMLPMDALWAKPIFEEQGEYIVFGKLLCENRDQIILVAAGTRSETPVKIKRLELACPVFHKKILKCKMAVDRKGAFYSGVIDESSIQFVPGSEIVTPPVRLKEKRPK